MEFERPVVEARTAGLPLLDIAMLEDAKRVALSVREQLESHRRREAELAALFQTASDLAALTSVDAVLAAIVRRARALLGRDIAYLCLNDEQRGDTYMRVTDGSVSGEFQRVRLPLGAGLGGLVALQGVPIAAADYFHDDRFPHTTTIDSAVHAEGLVSILGVPLKRGAQVIGVLFAADRRQREFSRDEVALLSSLAAHAAVALDNARLLAETRSALIGLEQAHAALREQARDTELAVTAHDRLAQLVLRGGGVAEVAAELAQLLGGPVELQAPAEMHRALDADQTSVPVAAGSEILGRLVLTRSADPPRAADLRVLERGAVVTALLLLFNRHLAEVANRGRRELLEDLLTGSVSDPDEITARAADLGAELTGDLVLLVCALQRQRTSAEQAAAYYAGRSGGLSARVNGRVVLLLPGSEPGPLARDAAGALTQSLGVPVTVAGERVASVAFGSSAAGLNAALAAAHRRAADCITAMVALGRTGEGADTADLGFVGVLLSGGDATRRFVDDTLGPILRYDSTRGSELATTLESWFGTGGHVGRTATALHLHPNTVTQRLGRVAALLGDDWTAPDRALQVHLALQLRGLLGSTSVTTAGSAADS